jgi:DNA mismatch repair ATPase MutS
MILTHFPAGSEDTVEKGRLGEECARLDAMFDAVTKNSLVLLDESLSSTGSYEGAYIAAEVLRGFSMAHLRGIFSTHLHDLAAGVEKINAECVPLGGGRIDNLVAEVNEGQRSFRILRKTPDGKSYARDIAEKYGPSGEKIMAKLEKNKNLKK